MARLTGENIEKFRAPSGDNDGQKRLSYFSLKKDKETAKIRLLYTGAEDIEGYVVHRVQVGDYERPVNCLLENNGTIDDCPFCKAGLKKQARVFVPVLREEGSGEIQIWERPNSFYGKLSSLCGRYPNIVSQVFEVERRGVERDPKTDYDFYPIGQADGTTVQDILDDFDMDELPKIVGSRFLMSKTADEMEYYIKHGEFPTERADAPVRRRGRTEPVEDLPFEKNEEPERRETRRGRGDRF